MRELTENVTRRDFLKTAAVSSGALVLYGLTSKAPYIYGTVNKKNKEFSFKENLEKVYTTCGICSSACAVTAYVKNGVLRFLTGNPEDPQSQGKLCAKGKSGAKFLYDPDRLKYPVMRTNPEKGIDVDPKWKRISWEEALDTIANKIREVKEKHGPQAIVFLTMPKPSVMKRLISAIGTPNLVTHHDTCVLPHVIVQKFTLWTKPWGWDLENARYILSFGWDQPAKGKIVFVRRFITAMERKAKIVVLNPMYSLTASKADEWIPIKPGTDLAFALAMINVILSENLYDRGFLEKYTNFMEHETEIKEWFREYTPEWASTLTEVPAETIRRIAIEFATTKPAVAPVHKRDPAGPNYANSWHLGRAILILNALVGSIDTYGGLVYPRGFKIPPCTSVFPPSKPFPTPPVEERIDGKEKLPLVKKVGLGLFSPLADNILKKKPYEIKMVIANAYNILAFPQPTKIIEALKKVEFVVDIDIYPSEMAQLADIALPDLTYLEKTNIIGRGFPRCAKIGPQAQIMQPVVKPMYEARGLAWICLELGKRVAPEYFKKQNGEFYTWSEYLEEAAKKGLGITLAELKKKGIHFKEEKFVPYAKLEAMVKKGKKIEVYGETFEKNGYDPLPKWVPPREFPSNEYPFRLLVSRSPVHRHTKTTNNVLLLELDPVNCVFINSEVAGSLGIKDLDWVYVESRVGKVKLQARLIKGIRKDCVAIFHGFGHWSKELKSGYGRGVNDGDLIPTQTVDEIIARGDPTAAGCMEDVCVRVYKA